MKEQQDIRWLQRFTNFKKALALLQEFVEKGELNKFEKLGLIKAFEYTYELAWNTIKDFYEYQGSTDLQGSRDTLRLAFKRGLIKKGDEWMVMLKDRHKTSQAYNEETAESIVINIFDSYFRMFGQLGESLTYFAEPDDDATRYGLKESTMVQINNIFAQYSEVEQAILYGSRAKGNYKPGSDIDLSLKGETLTWQTVQQIDNQLDDLLLPYTFDLSLYQQIDNADLLDHINRVGVPVYSKTL